MRVLQTVLTLLILNGFLFAQEVSWLHPNRGQWDERILYKVELNSGEMLIERDCFTYVMHNFGDDHSHDGSNTHEAEKPGVHVIRSQFTGSNWNGRRSEHRASPFYRNYILGMDSTRWKSQLHSYEEVILHDYYPGVDLHLSGWNGRIKYTWLLQAGVDPNIITSSIRGADETWIDAQKRLHLKGKHGEIIEDAPIAWQDGTQGRKIIDVRFKLKNSEVKFEFPKGYNSNLPLVIDPSLTFSTFSGATADNWGFTAAPDSNGKLFGGGVVFGLGYPVTVGAYDTSPNGGTIDVAITKFNEIGTALIYSTYIGGGGSETPNSIVCAPNGELYIFGITSSNNFPMAGASYDNTFNGGPSIANTLSNNLGFTGGADLYVARLSNTGGSLIASSYIGGTGTDGLNTSNLKFNYGDQFRGEIILDGAGNVYVASMTESIDFPVVAGAQGALNGTQDAVVFKMPPGLNTLLWSTYLGGSGLETANSVQVASNGSVYIAGGSTSGNMPFTSGYDLSYGGATDGYLARLNGANGALIAGTYVGENEYDQSYLVQLDIDDNVYLLGQTESNLGITAGHYGNANSGQFIAKYNTNLSSQLWKTMIGAGTGHVEISPTAFLVSDCYDIYLSGWGGTLNANPSVSQAIYSTSNGFPVTFDAYQSTTNGSNFYIAVLSQDAMTLKYATYFGGLTSSYNHVDGGTSRFDKAGRIYHAVCGGCGGNPTGFSTTPGTWSPTNQSNNCNMATFKFELSTIDAIVNDPNPVVCLPNSVDFLNNSTNGNEFTWYFGDGQSSTDEDPSHLYPGPGTYTVTLIVSDSAGCFTPDTLYFQVEVGDFVGGVVQPPGPICPGDSYQLEAFGGSVYQWSPAQFLNDPTIANPIATIDQTTDFMVIISDTCGIDTAYLTLPVFIGTSSISNDTSICIGQSVDLFVTGGVSYEWTPSSYLNDPFSPTPVCTPDQSITYTVDLITSNGCELTEDVTVSVFFTPPQPQIADTLQICPGAEIDVIVSGADTYLWSPDVAISSLTGSIVTVSPDESMYYYCDFINACGTVRDSVYINIIESMIEVFQDTFICPGGQATLYATGGVYYNWTPSATLSSALSSLVYATPTEPTMYYCTGTDHFGCTATDSVFVDLYPLAFIQTNPDVYAFYGDLVELSASSTTSGTYVWYPQEFLSCVACPNPYANPNQNYTYVVSYTDENGCSDSDSVTIYYDPILYIPNTFTPGEDGLNPFFRAYGGNIKSFEMHIFDRWGELIHSIYSLEEFWDGSYQGKACQDGTYTWKVTLTDYEGREQKHVGHVNLLR